MDIWVELLVFGTLLIHRIHGTGIYLPFGDFYSKCRKKITSPMEFIGQKRDSQNFPETKPVSWPSDFHQWLVGSDDPFSFWGIFRPSFRGYICYTVSFLGRVDFFGLHFHQKHPFQKWNFRLTNSQPPQPRPDAPEVCGASDPLVAFFLWVRIGGLSHGNLGPKRC